jgi:AbrB family looped-hinge helix DNA binding protein
MRITSKGQVTIPQSIRVKMGYLPNTEVVFEVRENEVVLRKAPPGRETRISSYLRAVRGSADTGMSTDQIMELTRESGDGDG